MTNKPMLSVERELLEALHSHPDCPVEFIDHLRRAISQPAGNAFKRCTILKECSTSASATTAAAQHQGEPVAQSEFECDAICKEADGCPTEGAVLKRFWRENQPDTGLCEFYEAVDYQSLVKELVGHVSQLQEAAKRNVKPWEDTFPPTLLPAYIARINAEQPAPAAVVMPERAAFEAWRDRRNMAIAESQGPAGYYVNQSHFATWEAALAEVARLNGVKP